MYVFQLWQQMPMVFGVLVVFFFSFSPPHPRMASKQLTSPAAVCDETPQEMNAKGMR